VSDERLGIGAKIATAPEYGQEELVICIYPKDFNDKEDVGRVARELHALGFDKKKKLWYKCDAFTHLDLKSGNEYDLRASLYASDDFVVKKPASKAKTSVLELLNGKTNALH
jgi:hypothetical protein